MHFLQGDSFGYSASLFTLCLDQVPGNWARAEKELESVACLLEHFRKSK